MRYTPLLTAGWFLCAPLSLSAAAAAQPSPVGFDSSFIQVRTLPGFSTPLISRGRVRIDNAHGFLWEITSPYHYVFEMSGDQVQEQLPDGTVRHLSPAQTPWLAAVERIFMSALAGNRSDLSRYFEVSVKQLPEGQSILLTPKPGPMASTIRSIQVTETAPGHPQRLVIRENTGGSMDIRFATGSSTASGSS
jgi:Outer membrane lipoprotein carrier protein LolA-like